MEQSIISLENEKEEKKTLHEIYKAIDSNQSILFKAGAGAGKTFSLVKSLKYIINNYGEILKKNNQKILCITYTNIATKEIRNRLGSSSIVEVSTIHECIWKIIRQFQSELMEVHKSKLSTEIERMKDELENQNWAKEYKILENKCEFRKLIIENKDICYKSKNECAKKIRENLEVINDKFPRIMSNIENFKKIYSKILMIERYKKIFEQIANKKNKVKNIEYDAKSNNDRLEKMKISHDTLLEYMNIIIKQNKLMKRIVCDMYPFILVDEYQDTNVKVIETLNSLQKYAEKFQKEIFIAYFGDDKQNIYGEGIGRKIEEKHENLKVLYKLFNRRSAKKIIEVANKIRNDELEQKTIYSNCPEGEVSFYRTDISNISKKIFIDKHIEHWNIGEKNKLYCFELTNELVAEQNEFDEIYKFFKSAPYYKGINYTKVNEDTLSKDIKKLGEIQLMIFRILDFKNKIKNDKTSIQEIIPKNVIQNITISRLRKLIMKLKKCEGKSLYEYIQNSIYNKESKDYEKCIEFICDMENINDEVIEENILEKLFLNLNQEVASEEVEKYKDKILNFLKLDIEKFDKWYKFLVNTDDKMINYCTYHSTKGLEFDNVIIFMESKFGKDKKYFENLFKNLGVVTESCKIEEARNLLYVGITRAKKNLSILYMGDVEEVRNEIEDVFGKIKYQIDI